MPYELLDVVDENDAIQGTIERTPEWNKTRPTIHRIANVLIFNSEGKLLVQQRGKHKPMGALLFDASVGGMVSSGQTYAAAAEKEAVEELGYTGPLEFVTKFKHIDPTTQKLSAFHGLFEAVFDGPYQNWEAEAERLEFLSIEEAKMMTQRFPYLFTPGFRDALKAYIEAKDL